MNNHRSAINQNSPTDADSPPPNRKQPLLIQLENRDRESTNRRRRIEEVAGGATAECAVVCCCVPVALINLLILAVYKVPAGLGKKMWRRKKKKRLLKKQRKMNEEMNDYDEKRNGGSDGSGSFDGDVDVKATVGFDFDDQVMWDDLYGTGFWRIPSQKEEDTVVKLD